jgi:hypothetical protein
MIVDTVDAMIYQRPYNTPNTFGAAADEVRRCSGTQFDPRLVEGTLDFLGKQIPVSSYKIWPCHVIASSAFVRSAPARAEENSRYTEIPTPCVRVELMLQNRAC